MDRETIVKILPVELSEDELKVKTTELTTALKKRDLIETEKKSAAAVFKSQIEDISLQISELTSTVHEKKERRPVQCYIRFNYERNLVETVRTDLGEIVESRSMTIAERQQKLEFEKA